MLEESMTDEKGHKMQDKCGRRKMEARCPSPSLQCDLLAFHTSFFDFTHNNGVVTEGASSSHDEGVVENECFFFWLCGVRHKHIGNLLPLLQPTLFSVFLLSTSLSLSLSLSLFNPQWTTIVMVTSLLILVGSLIFKIGNQPIKFGNIASLSSLLRKKIVFYASKDQQRMDLLLEDIILMQSLH
jgi:hypothetical protein